MSVLVMQMIRRINEARKEEEVPADEDAAVEDEGIKIIGEAEAAMHDVHDMDYDTIDLSEQIGMLNEDQRRIFDQVVTLLIVLEASFANSHDDLPWSCNL